MQTTLSKSLPVTAFAFLIGICLTILAPQLPSQPWAFVILTVALLSLCLRTNYLVNVASIVALGFALMLFHIHQHQTHILPLTLEAKKIVVTGTISSVVEDSKKPKARFHFDVRNVDCDGAEWKLPARIQLTWSKPKRLLQPGDTWKLQIKVKRPRNYSNPGSFDVEKFMFQQRIVGTGYVVDSKENHFVKTNLWLAPINTIRQSLLRTMRSALSDNDFGNVIVSMVLGVKGEMPQELQTVLQNTGTAHLLAISGLHISILASICFIILRFAWRFLPEKWLFIPAPWLAACGALIISFAYAVLAGLSIATQRALIMITVFMSGIVLKRKISTKHSFCLALLLILLWDPFVILSMGFWFSFVAVAFLIYAAHGKKNWLRPQLIITAALLPLNMLFFGKSSIIGPLANCIAIPWVGIAVLPLSLIAVLVMKFVPSMSILLWNVAEQNFSYIWPLLNKLSVLPTYSWQMPTMHLGFIIGSSILGATWLFMPRGLPGRWWGLLGFLPIFLIQNPVIPYGQAEFTLLDVGQGLSVVIRTKQHVLVYDTGAKINDFDLGARVVVPYLNYVGVKQLDMLMISHGDNDHVGGALSVLEIFPAKTILTSDEQTLNAYKPIQCVAGQEWGWDGVVFKVLHPELATFNRKRNDQSCVLMVHAGDQKVLLTGDIEKRAEKQLIARYGQDLRADLMLVPHHGSKTSSSLEFIQQVQPKFALIPVGYKNQYGHPKEQVLQRYIELGVNILRTEQDGAISFTLGNHSWPHCYRRETKGFWAQGTP